MTTAMTICERKMPEFSGGYAEIERKEREWREDNRHFDNYVSIGVRHSAELLLLYNDKSISQLEQTLGRSFQTEVAALRALPAMQSYLKNISKFTPAARTARLAEVAASRQNLIDEPSEKSLERYQKALAAKISKAETAGQTHLNS